MQVQGQTTGAAANYTQESLVNIFSERARSVAAHVSLVASVEEAATIILSAGGPTTTGRYTISHAALSSFPALRDAFNNRGIELRVAEEVEAVASSPSAVAASLAGDTGIILAYAGVAETGSFLSADESLPARFTGMLSDTAYALLPASKIVPTLDEMGSILAQLTAEGKRYLSLVTGPSRTADIERVLTIGVQGPKLLHVIVVRDE